MILFEIHAFPISSGSSTPAGVRSFYSICNRGYRSAQPPANCCDPYRGQSDNCIPKLRYRIRSYYSLGRFGLNLAFGQRLAQLGKPACADASLFID